MRVYEGRQPYVFVSYSHKDSQVVFPVIAMLQSRGFRVWFDPGIEPGTDWPDYIAEHIDACTVFLCFMSAHASASPHCRQEVHRAIEKNKAMLVAYLDDGPISPGLEMELARLQSMMLWNFTSPADFAEAIVNTRPLQACKDEAPVGGSRGGAQTAGKAAAPLRSSFHDANSQAEEQVQTKRRSAGIRVALVALVVAIACAVAFCLGTVGFGGPDGGRSGVSGQPAGQTSGADEGGADEGTSADEGQRAAIEITSSEVIPYVMTGNQQTPTAEEYVKEPVNVRDAFSLLSFVNNPGDKPVMITSTTFVAEEVEPIAEPDVQLEAIMAGDELLIYAVNNGWGSYSGGEIKLVGTTTDPTQKVPLSELFASEMDYEAEPLGSGIIRLVGRYRIDAESFKNVAKPIEPARKTSSFDYDWECQLSAQMPDGMMVGMGTLVCDSDDRLSVIYLGKGSALQAAVRLFAVLDVDQGPSRISFTNADSTPRIEDVFRIETTIAPTKSCSVRCRAEFGVGGNVYATDSHEAIVTVPVYEAHAIAGYDDGGSRMTRELAANPDASNAEIRQIAQNYLYNPEDLQ